MLYATLIGINAYPRNELNGCVQDVLSIDRLLRDLCRRQAQPIEYAPLYLLAPHDVDKLRISDHERDTGVKIAYQSPDFQNVSQKAFAHLKQAGPGDICVFYYSGHGSQCDAPPEFWGRKSDRKNETIVCVDSRSNPDARDLTDKEMAWLLWDALHHPDGSEKGVRAVVIMDCCHSGNNTRGDSELPDAFRYRHAPAFNKKIPLTEYLGYNEGFYQIKDGEAQIRHARYVHLAAARDHEKALETSLNGGLFTGKLVEVLRAGGAGKTCRALLQNLIVSVRNRAEQQHPVAWAAIPADLDVPLLGGQVQALKPSFELRFDPLQDRWILHGGRLDGLVPSRNGALTVIRVEGSNVEAQVTAVENSYSVVEGPDLARLNQENETYSAVLTRLASPKIKVALSQGVRSRTAWTNAIQNAYQPDNHLYFEWASPEQAAYLVHITEQEAWGLTKAGSLVPLFKRETNPVSFLNNMDALGHWLQLSELKNDFSGFQESDFIFRTEVIEGQPLSYQNLNTVKGKVAAGLPDTITLSYQQGRQPALRISIALAPHSTITECYVGALYLTSQFGVDPDYISSDAGRLVRGGDPVQLRWMEPKSKKDYSATPFQLDPGYTSLGINEITGYFKIFVSNEPLDELHRHRQDSLELDPGKPNFVMRAKDTGLENEDTGDRMDWTVFTTRLRLIGPNKQKALLPGQVTDFMAFNIQAPEGFSAMVFAVTGDDQKSEGDHPSYGRNKGDSGQVPADLWEHTLEDISAFPSGMNSSADNHIQVLELLPAEGVMDFPALQEGQELIITPAFASNWRSADAEDLESAIVPYGYDPEAGLYFPLGYSDEQGRIHIRQLPPPTDGRWQPDGVRSLGGSMKLYFKKLFRRQPQHRLRLYACAPEGNWKELTDQPASMQPFLKQHNTQKALLLVHGYTGDTQHIIASVKALKGLDQSVGTVLTFDYESLSTPIEKTAEWLQKALESAGFGQKNMPKLVILAHSMGGLVSRWMVEKTPARAWARHLVIVGSPFGGSPLSKTAQGVLSSLTHAMNVTGPLKLALTGLSFLLKKIESDPTHTLRQLEPGSPVLQQLALSQPPETARYRLIGGDIALLKEYDGDDQFFKKLAWMLKNRVASPALTHLSFDGEPNDMIVACSSMTALRTPPGTPEMTVVGSDHLAYFRERRCQQELIQMLFSD